MNLDRISSTVHGNLYTIYAREEAGGGWREYRGLFYSERQAFNTNALVDAAVGRILARVSRISVPELARTIADCQACVNWDGSHRADPLHPTSRS